MLAKSAEVAHPASGSKGSTKTPTLDELRSANPHPVAAEASLTPWWDATTRLIGVIQILGRRTQKQTPCLIRRLARQNRPVAEGLARDHGRLKDPDILDDKRRSYSRISPLVAGTKYRVNLRKRLKEDHGGDP